MQILRIASVPQLSPLLTFALSQCCFGGNWNGWCEWREVEWIEWKQSSLSIWSGSKLNIVKPIHILFSLFSSSSNMYLLRPSPWLSLFWMKKRSKWEFLELPRHIVSSALFRYWCWGELSACTPEDHQIPRAIENSPQHTIQWCTICEIPYKISFLTFQPLALRRAIWAILILSHFKIHVAWN